MNTRLFMFVINGVLGITVLLSYIWGAYAAEDPSALWGEMPEQYITYIICSMFIAAIGYILYSLYIAYGREISLLERPFYKYNLNYIILLISASLWMPLTVFYVDTSSSIYWILLVISLYIVGFMSCYMTYLLIKSTPTNNNNWKFFSILGSIWFTFHTLILDAMLWVFYFH